jgi:L-ascorbate metabolism protein UlaG (beta-lactamase superfamily)
MDNKPYYLKPNVQIEPLFNQWYAWSHLIAPATAAMNIGNSHIKIMKSYIMAPEIHATAVKNPAMRGGPFLDFDSARVGEIRGLLDRTMNEQAHMVEFSIAIKRLNDLLINESRGQSLEPLYEKVPDALRGYVELVYDLNHRPAIRLLEGLLYQSAYYDPGRQSISLSICEGDDRPFVFSTPRIASETRVTLNLPFSHSGIDELSKMRHTPQSLGYIQEVLGIAPEDEPLFASFFTTDVPPPAPKYTGEAVRIRYFGHACILIESKDVSVMIDPLVSYEYESDIFRYSFSSLPEKLDYVLITHAHSDHIVMETLLQLRHKIGTIVVPKSGGGALEDPSMKLMLQHTGFKNVIELDEMETIPVPGGSLTGIPFLGEHGDLNTRTKLAHYVKLGGRSLLYAADSRNVDNKLYERVHESIGDIETVFIGMECDGAPLSWLYGPLLMRPLERKLDQTRRFSGSDFVRAFDIVRIFNSKEVYVYAMGQEPWLNFITSIKYTDESNPIVESNKLVAACRSRGIAAERLYGCKELSPSS